MSIPQGSTPTNYFDLPIEAAMLATLRITFKQGDEIILEKELADCVSDGNVLTLTLTQDETLMFDHNKPGKVQLHGRTIGGQALVSQVFVFTVDELLSGRVV